MNHFDSELSQRFARSCTTAAFGYARAASAAYAAFATQAIDFWTQSSKAGATSDDFKPSTPYLVTGPRPYRSAVTSSAAAALPTDFGRMVDLWADSPMFAPVRAWWGLFPLEGNPASWPMAYSMMTAGVPRAVALPAAEANMAAMDAAEAASTSINRAFSSYQSESGFAVSRIVSPKALYGALFLAPFAQSVKLPWA
ncbi:hypothetical protein [Hyphomicrobium sp.]|uniref:hypothetical protein n=1 Tax=Hyphomicrobium sp. TaxID=82 RepID=UPI002E37CD29|nr:hypothetical protein [Hyphomicrobium sp.]HEX2840821.1 hypothetical protein [Hyphomicrobium sp.]